MKTEQMTDNQIIKWLLDGDPSIRWQTLNNLTGTPSKKIELERNKVSKEGWGAKLLSFQNENGLWADSLYSRKWISTTYTMILLKSYGLNQHNKQANKACSILLNKGFYKDEGINYFSNLKHSETCVTGMILSLLSYFLFDDERIHRLVSHLLNQQMKDGGWNCQSYSGAMHSSFHTTLLVLEGLREYEKSFANNLKELKEVQKRGIEFLLRHRLFRSHKTGKVFDSKMTRLTFPYGWRYDILRALDYIREADACLDLAAEPRRKGKDERMSDAISIIIKKRNENGVWLMQSRPPGKLFFEMENRGDPSRWNTLRALRILKWWES